MSGERWRLCTVHAGYLVSDAGRVRRVGGRILKPQRQSKGYRKLHLGRALQVYVHALVAEAFHGPRPAGHDVDHLNFDRADNRAANLRWLPSLENAFRWAGRASDGSIIWENGHDDEPPEDHRPMTDTEQAAVMAHLGATWHEEEATR